MRLAAAALALVILAACATKDADEQRPPSLVPPADTVVVPTPDAMFKTGLAFEKSGDLAMARRSLEECIRRYPYSTSASSAKLELKRIKY